MHNFQFKILRKIALQFENQRASNFITSQLLLNSNILAIKPIILTALERSQTRKTIKTYSIGTKTDKTYTMFFYHYLWIPSG